MSKHVKKHASFRSGLSHFEMMIVVSVIIIIAAVLLPVLRRAKKHGEQAHCLGNQRQLMTAWYNFAIDSEDQLCESDRYIESLLPYTQSQEVFYCVSVKKPWELSSTLNETSPIDDTNAVTQNENTASQEVDLRSSYDLMIITNEEGLENVACYAVSNTMRGEYRDGIQPFRKYQKIKQASRRMVFTDIEPPAGPTFWPIIGSSNRWSWRPRSWPPSLQGLTARHRQGVNYVFADGHGEHYRWVDASTIAFINSYADGGAGEPPRNDYGSADLNRMVGLLIRD